jgi:hypothetical protein
MGLVTNSFQASLVIDVTHTDSGLVAAHHTANLAIMSPSVNISELLQRALEVSDGPLLDLQRGVVGDEAAWGTSYHCKDLQRPAWLRPHSRLARAVSRSEKLLLKENVRRFHLDIARK